MKFSLAASKCLSMGAEDSHGTTSRPGGWEAGEAPSNGDGTDGLSPFSRTLTFFPHCYMCVITVTVALACAVVEQGPSHRG